jgi:hypothetical protein
MDLEGASRQKIQAFGAWAKNGDIKSRRQFSDGSYSYKNGYQNQKEKKKKKTGTIVGKNLKRNRFTEPCPSSGL